MLIRDLDYQARVLRVFDEYLTKLSAAKTNADAVAEFARQRPELKIPVPDYAAEAWTAMRNAGALPTSRAGILFSPRHDGIGGAVPNTVFKVPTGGGKTYLAASALSRIFGRYLGLNTGFVLWIVPNEAIYAQTWKRLNDRQHPYRQILDRAAAGRVRLLQKDSPLDARDVDENLCVMLLMLQAANRQTRESLKMFRDRGDVHGFFPSEGDQEAHALALVTTPNLDRYDLADAHAQWPMVKDSLGNALRLIRPVVVMDEGHRAIADLAFETLYGFNPCFVLELTATPKDVAARGGANPRPARHANVLVEVRGIDLDREGMIKMPLNLDARQGTDWRATLASAIERLNKLEAEAQRLRAENKTYIRPILLVQVERTGSDQRDGHRVHALDAKDWLMRGGFDDAEIAIKTADTNDLANPENQDLLVPASRVRVIITKQALQEGWDCPFAYVLCTLAASANLGAMTQLVGRILRQPYAQKTNVASLDECYVITHHASTGQAVDAIKTALEEDGLGDLVKEIKTEGPGNTRGARAIKRRPAFATTEIFLPRVVRVADGDVRDLDYEQDILFGLNWADVNIESFVRAIPDNAQVAEGQMRRIRLVDSGMERIQSEEAGRSSETLRFEPTYAVRMVSDIVPNPWIARQIVGEAIEGLRARGFSSETLGKLAGLIVAELRKWLDAQRDAMAEVLFRTEVAAGRIQFRLRTDSLNWQMPHEALTFEPDTAEQLVSKNGGPLERSLFTPIYKGDFSSRDERDVAVYLDGEQALNWWHRNVARSQFSVQGWRREKVYPDFIFALRRGDGSNKLVVLEMKGHHLAGNDDTNYKQKLLRFVSEHYAIERVGNLELVDSNGTTLRADLVLFPDWRRRLPSEFLM